MSEATRNAGEPSYCVLVSSCDSYADCWPPFFTLLRRYWKPRPPTIYLNTETEGFAFPHLDIRCPRVQLATERNLAWGARLLDCLAWIPHEYVLYLQEDYFIHGSVDLEMIERLVRLMARDRISHISLVRGRRRGTHSAAYSFLDKIAQRTEYRVSAQAGLWRTSSLRSYLRRHETVWEFEWYGTRRAWRKPDRFFYVNADYEDTRGGMVIPYKGTGVVHGRWAREVVENLFAAHGISVDYSIRGFYDQHDDVWEDGKPLLARAVRRLRSIP